MPDADLLYEEENSAVAPDPAAIRQQKEEARRNAEEKREALDSRIRTLTDVFDEKDGKKLQLRDIIYEYIGLGEFPFLEVLCSKLGYDYAKVAACIAKRDGNPNREPFSTILLEVERDINKRRGVFLRELAFQIAAAQQPEHSDQYHIKDRLAAIKQWDSLVRNAADIENQSEGEGGLQIPDGMPEPGNPEDYENL